jgi:hypothetical protein
MTSKTKAEIKAFFQTGDKPTEAQFIDFIDSYVDKSGPLGTLEAAASGLATGVGVFAAGTPSIASYAAVRSSMGIEVYTSAQSDDIARAAVSSLYATTAQATSGLATDLLMNPVLVRNAVEQFAPSTTSGLVPIKTITVTSTVASVNFVNGSGGVVFDGTYRAYLVIGSDIRPVSNSTDLLLRTSTNAGSSYDSGASDYRQSGLSVTSGGTPTGAGSTTTSILLCQNMTNNADYGNGLVLYLFNPSGVKRFLIKSEMTVGGSSGQSILQSMTGMRDTTADVDAFGFSMATGDIAAGAFTLYGLKDA